jgi:hypothetical protein
MLMEWGFPLEPYVGPVLLIYGRDSIQGNPYMRFHRPDLAWDRAFVEYAVAETEMASGSKCNIAVRIRNTSTITWPAWDKSGLTLGNRWLDQAGAVIKWIDGRVPLPRLAPMQRLSFVDRSLRRYPPVSYSECGCGGGMQLLV